MSEAAVLNKEEKMKRAEELLKQKREQRAEEEFQAEKNREMKRRSAGKELSDAARAREQKANETWMQERQQAKEEDKKARAEVLAKLEQDKEERRRAREDKESELRKRHSSPTSSPPSMSSRSSGTTRLQFRVQKGSPIVQEFNSSDQLIDARTFIAEVSDYGLHSCLCIQRTCYNKLPYSENLSIADCLCGSRSVLMHTR